MTTPAATQDAPKVHAPATWRATLARNLPGVVMGVGLFVGPFSAESTGARLVMSVIGGAVVPPFAMIGVVVAADWLARVAGTKVDRPENLGRPSWVLLGGVLLAVVGALSVNAYHDNLRAAVSKCLRERAAAQEVVGRSPDDLTYETPVDMIVNCGG